MARVSVIRNKLQKFGEELHIIGPRPHRFRRNVIIHVPDEVAKAKMVQPTLDAYAIKVNRPEWVGKTMEQYRTELWLQLGFKVLSYDDGSSVLREVIVDDEQVEFELFKKGDKVQPKKDESATGIVKRTSEGGLFVYVDWAGTRNLLGSCWMATSLKRAPETEEKH